MNERPRRLHRDLVMLTGDGDEDPLVYHIVTPALD